LYFYSILQERKREHKQSQLTGRAILVGNGCGVKQSRKNTTILLVNLLKPALPDMNLANFDTVKPGIGPNSLMTAK
jgi:hypothetical protein